VIVHAPDSAFAREMTKWEAKDGVLGPGLRPYIKREYPMMLHKAAAMLQGGIEIVATAIVHTEDERAHQERVGFRPTPLEAIEALEAEQTNHAELAAERNFEVRRMTPRAQLEVVRAEDAAGAVHLPTIPETPHGLRGVPVPLSAKAADMALGNAEELIAQQQAELAELRAMLAAKPVTEAVAEPAAAPKRGRGRPKKSAAVAE